MNKNMKVKEIRITKKLIKQVLKEITTDELVSELSSKRIGNGVSLVVRKGNNMIELDGKQAHTENICIRQRLG
jgi:hypothetical protein